MDTIPGWDGPRQRLGRDQTCYWRIVGQRMGQSSEQHIGELLSQGVLPKRMFIKVKGSDFSGGVLFMPDAEESLPGTAEKLKNPWEVVLESGKWVRYDLHLVLLNGDLVTEHGDLKLVRLGTGTPLNEDIGSIREMAAWLDMQMESYGDVSNVQIIVLFENRGQYLPFGLNKHIKILQQDFSSAICLPKDERRKASHLFLCHAL